MTTTDTPTDLIPLAAGAIALGYAPGSVYVLLSKGRFNAVPVYYTTNADGRKRYAFVSRAEVMAALQSRPHLTKAQYAAIETAHREADRTDAMSRHTYTTDAEMLAAKEWLSTEEVARVLGVNAPQVRARAKRGTLPFELVEDPNSHRGARRAKALDVAAYLATQEPAWPMAEDFAAVPALGLDEVKLALGDDSPAGADDPVTEVFLRSREVISTGDFALMLGITKDGLKRRIQRGHVQTVEDESLTGSTRKHKRIRSDYAADVLAGRATA
ncbi:hypothetical protein [Arthrobacter sp. 2MCAF14]|uniref:hypothetical protein n=1 Tax=Arthrobacter sp. 2MCAF14 TaxID=3232982 RepID=UPI003F925281